MTLLFLGNRDLVPNWRSYSDTIVNGEFDGAVNQPFSKKRFDISEYVEEWKVNRSMSHAGELLSAALANSSPIEGDVEDACEYIINKSNKKNSPLYCLAISVLDRNNTEKIHDISVPKPNLDAISAKKQMRQDIHKWRLAISRYPYNPISRIELSRAYLCFGLKDKARQEALIAVRFAPDNRFVSRSAARCLIQIGNLDEAKHILKCNSYLKSDPWLLATDIGIDILRGKTPRYITQAIRMDEDKNYSPLSISELSMALATNELHSGGKNKIIRRFVNSGLVHPIDNSLAQAQWISSINPAIEIDPYADFKINFNYEAQTFDLFFEFRLKEAYNSSILWMKDSGFSQRAALAASNLAVYNDHMEDGINILKIGLIANPDDKGLINNLVYNYLLVGDTDSAGQLIEGLDTHDGVEPLNISLTATKGMYYFRNKEIVQGENLYNLAMELARKRKDKKLEQNAMINLTREKYIAGIISKDDALRHLNEIDDSDLQLKIVRDGVIKYIDSHKNG